MQRLSSLKEASFSLHATPTATTALNAGRFLSAVFVYLSNTAGFQQGQDIMDLTHRIHTHTHIQKPLHGRHQ